MEALREGSSDYDARTISDVIKTSNRNGVAD